MSDEHLFQAAREASARADYSGANAVQIGCVIAYKKNILAKGWNTDKTHPQQAYYNQYRFKQHGNNYLPDKCHAEAAALNRISNLNGIDWNKVHVYVYRAYKDGSLAPSRPCPSCIAYLKSLHIKHLHYTTKDGYAHEEIKYDE